MEEKDKQLFRLTWSLVEKHQVLLGDAFPLIHDIVATLHKGLPSREQLDAWQESYRAFDQRLHELTVAFAELIQDVDPTLRGYDA
jgi:hypothetical protein